MKIAVLTHTFPPTNHGNAKRPFYVVQSLLDAGWEVDVYTSPYGCDGNVDEAIKHTSLRVFVIGDFRQKLVKLAAKVPLLSRLCTVAISGLSWPDVSAPWVKVVSKKLLENKPYDRVLAFVFPSSMFLTGRYEDLVDGSWTFDLQESVTPQARIVKRRSPLIRWRLPKLEVLEKQSFSKAGKVIFTANTNREAYIKAGIVELEKTIHIPYFYDESYFQNLSVSDLKKGFNIVYFGTFDWRGNRSPVTFLKSLRIFLNANPAAKPLTKFVFYGSWLVEHNSLIKELDLKDNVEINKAVSYDDYMKKLRVASILLLVVSSEHNLFMPSKIVDYFGAQRPILAYVPEDSEMSEVLQDAGMENYSVSEYDVDKGAVAIEELWSRFQRDDLILESENFFKWSSSNLMPKYIKILER